jgi:5-methylcytosine-specific restriction enzyme subunit McrC
MDAGVAALAGRAPTMVDAFMRVYVTQLAVEWRRGHIANYRKHDANRMALRGKLLFDGHIRLNRLHPERFYTRADEFLQDVAISRLLKAGLRACRRYSTTDGLRQETTSLLAEFDGVRDQYTVTSDLLDIEVDRRTARFGPLVELAKLLLVGQVPDRSGENSTFSLVFDMNVVFERFIARLLTRVTAGSEPSRRVRRQLTGRSLLIQAGKQRFGLRPDVEVSADGMRLCLLDTKWKRLDPLLPHHGVSQADMYQMFAYGKVYDCPVVILLYPRHGDFAARVATYAHHPGEPGSARIEVCTVDIRQPPARGEQSVYAQLHDLLEETIGGAGHASGAPRSTADGPTTFIHGVHHD